MTDPYKETGLLFGDVVGEPEPAFAWMPRKCFDGSWVWMRPIWRRLCILKPYLDNPYGSNAWWQYARRNDQ